MLGSRVFTFNEFVCDIIEIIGVPEIVNPEMFGPHDGEVDMREWNLMQMLRQWFSCEAML